MPNVFATARISPPHTARSPGRGPAAPGRPVGVLLPRELLLPIVAAALLLGAYLLRIEGAYPWLRSILLIGSFAFSSRYTVIAALHALRRLRFDVDVLMFLAAGGAVALGRYEEAALLLTLFGLGSAGENLAMDRARNAIRALSDLAPDRAVVRDADGVEREVAVPDLAVGMQVVVRPFDRLAADGVVASGASAVDQSPLTGESVPVEKSTGDPLYAGTINGGGMLLMTVTRPVHETRLSKVIELVARAQEAKSPTQVLTDRVERWYVPGVLIATLGLILVPPLVSHVAWATAFYRAMAFLTAASPCALAIGTPAAVLSGIARAARGGVLIKGGVHLENLGGVRALAFDKTGTLTHGRAEVAEVLPLRGMDVNMVLSLAAAVEQNSNHPLARAIVAEARARGCPPLRADNVLEVPGVGVRGRVGAATIEVGRASVLLNGDAVQRSGAGSGSLAADVVLSVERAGRTAIVVLREGMSVGIIALADRPRENVQEVLARLRRIGIKRHVMLTGDNERVAAAIAGQVGVDEFHARLLPEDKVGVLKQLIARHGRVAMVGDGTNDAPALATATVGIAMGAAGTDVALETADIALMADDLEKLPEAIGLSRFSRKIILQNLVIALGVIAVVAPIAALGGATLGVAVVFHEGSTVLVVLNALRLLVYRQRGQTATDGA